MPWTEPLANSDELRRCIRDLVALSTFPAAWRKYDERQLGDSIVAALITMLASDVVLIIHLGQGNQLAELVRSKPDRNRASPEHGRTALKREKAAFSLEEEFGDAFGGNQQAATSSIGLGGDALLVVGSSCGTGSNETELPFLTTGANQAAIAFHLRSSNADAS